MSKGNRRILFTDISYWYWYIS